MSSRKPRPSPRFRVGKVSVYEHHGAWWIYYRDGTGPHRKKVAPTRDRAEQVAARVNSQLASDEPTLLTFTPIAPAELRRQFLDYHEHVLHSSVGTLNRYRSATQHLEDFVAALPKVPAAHELPVQAFAAYLRRIEVAPNGHANTAKRKLRSKGVQYVLQTCRAMYNYAVKRRHLPPYAGNPFAEPPTTTDARGHAGKRQWAGLLQRLGRLLCIRPATHAPRFFAGRADPPTLARPSRSASSTLRHLFCPRRVPLEPSSTKDCGRTVA